MIPFNIILEFIILQNGTWKILGDFNIITVSFWFSTFYFSDELQLDIIEEKRKE